MFCAHFSYGCHCWNIVGHPPEHCPCVWTRPPTLQESVQKTTAKTNRWARKERSRATKPRNADNDQDDPTPREEPGEELERLRRRVEELEKEVAAKDTREPSCNLAATTTLGEFVCALMSPAVDRKQNWVRRRWRQDILFTAEYFDMVSCGQKTLTVRTVGKFFNQGEYEEGDFCRATVRNCTKNCLLLQITRSTRHVTWGEIRQSEELRSEIICGQGTSWEKFERFLTSHIKALTDITILCIICFQKVTVEVASG